MIVHIDTLASAPGLLICSVASLVIGATLGVWLGLRIVRGRQRTLERTLARRELALLDSRRQRSEQPIDPLAFDAHSDPYARVAGDDDVVLSAALRQLDEARDRAESLAAALDAQERHHALAIAKLKLIAVRARKRAQVRDAAAPSAPSASAPSASAPSAVARTTPLDTRATPSGAPGTSTGAPLEPASERHGRQERRRAVQERRVARHDRRTSRPADADAVPASASAPVPLSRPAGDRQGVDRPTPLPMIAQARGAR